MDNNPNIRFNSIIQKMNCCFGINDIFDIYHDKNNNNELCLIFPSDNFVIKITRLLDNHLIKSLEGHTGKISFLKHFYNEFEQKDYLISSGKKSVVKVWDLSDNYNLLYTLNINYSTNSIIYNCTVLFTENKGNFLIISSNENQKEDYTKIYDFNTEEFIADLEATNYIEIFCLLIWKNNDKNYLIESSIGNILIHNLETKELIKILSTNKKSIQNSMCLINDPDSKKLDLLCVTTVHGLINFWDLGNFTLKFSIKYKSSYFYDIINWNDNYIIVGEKNNSSIIIIDVLQRRVITVIKNKNISFVITLKKLNHPLYGQSLLINDLKNNIILFSHV